MSATTDHAKTSVDLNRAIQETHLRLDLPHAGSQQPLELTESMDLEGPGSGPGAATGAGMLASADLLEVEEPSAEMIAAVAGQTSDAYREQAQLHIAQLAGHLRDRLREVDRREAALHARTSQLDADVRAARLWLQEREVGFQERERDLQRQIEDLEERATSHVVQMDAEVEDPQAILAELKERDEQLRQCEDDVRERRFAVEREAVALRHAQQVWQQQREREERSLTQQREQSQREIQELVNQRESQLRAAEVLLMQHVEQFDRDRAGLLKERQAWDDQRARQHEAIAELQRNAEAELADARSRLDARQDWIERQKSGLEQVRDEALRLHRQSLEMRLLAEQLWAQISGALTPAEVTQSIAQMRLKLAEQYRLEEQQLLARREELLKVGEAVAAQHSELEQLRTGLREWDHSRQQEIQRQAASLVERELALDGQQEAHHRAERQWQADRRSYEQQIRDLSTQLRTLPVAA